MKFLKILLRAIFVIFAIACLSTAVNVGIFKALYMSLVVLAFGFGVTHPLNLDQTKYKHYNLNKYRIGVFLLAFSVFIILVTPVISTTIPTSTWAILQPIVMATIGIALLIKSKSGRNET